MTPHQDLTQEKPTGFIGRVIGGNFRIEKLIGSGATGNVYRAEQLSLGKAVALKVLHPHLMNDDKLVRRFQREAKSASRLNHPNSVQIIESGQDETGPLFIAMELLTGRDLAQVIRDEFPLPVPRMVHIMSQVFAALDEAHAHGLIHRDLKPSNIMLIERRDQPDFVKVCDYGIAKAISEDSVTADAQMLTVQGLVCGTPEYMSPEQARGESLDGRTDLYSAAVILYQMTTGDVPFRAATPIGIVSRHLSDEPVLPSSRRADGTIPHDLDDLILRGLAKSRELRPGTAAIFRDELHRILTDGMARRAFADAQTLTLGSGSGSMTATRLPRTSTPAATPIMPLPPARTSRKPLAIGLGGAALVLLIAVIASRRFLGPLTAAAPSAATLAGPAVAAAAPVPPAPHEPAAETAPPIAPAPALAAPSPATPSPGGPAAHERQARHKAQAAPRASGHPARETNGQAASAQPAETAPPTAAVAAPAPPQATDPTTEATVSALSAPPSHGPREAVAEGEKLLAQGDAVQACRKGEEAKRANPKAAPVYKFLGKCYMRAGSAPLAKENYRHYLELAPNAPDAVFIESMIK